MINLKVNKNLNSGFSLMELLIAIIIMGILGGIVVPKLLVWRDEAKEKATMANIKIIDQAISSYQMRVGDLPQKLSNLVIKPAGLSQAQWKGPYLKSDEIPLDNWGEDFVYKLKPKESIPPYELYSWGSEGAGSDSGDWIKA